jgi:DNA-binding NarL/FixJ family response regulator
MRILIVDDSAAFRRGMRHLLSAIDDCDVIAEAGDGATGVAAALELQPDIVLMDLSMPGMSGIDATRRIAAAQPHVGVVAMTMLADEAAVGEALRAGARGYVVKGAGAGEILDALRGVHAGRAVLGAGVARTLGGLVGAAPADPFPDLTPREHEVLNLLAANASTDQIAGTLGVSGKTIRNHLSAIFTKIEVVDRAAAITKARDAGFPR